LAWEVVKGRSVTPTGFGVKVGVYPTRHADLNRL
jgi:hypothetical protein